MLHIFRTLLGWPRRPLAAAGDSRLPTLLVAGAEPASSTTATAPISGQAQPTRPTQPVQPTQRPTAMPLGLMAMLAAPLALAAWLQAGPAGLWLVCGSALLEEWVFRAGLQDALLRRAARRDAAGRWAPPEAAINALVALLFALAHVPGHGLVWAAAVLPVAGVMGALYQRWRSTALCSLAHAAANLFWLAFWPSFP